MLKISISIISYYQIQVGILPKITTKDSVKLDSKVRKYKAFKNLTNIQNDGMQSSLIK